MRRDITRGDFLGVYSTKENRLNAGKSVVTKCLWYVWTWDQGTVMVQEISQDWKIIAKYKIILRVELESRYSPERDSPPEMPRLPKNDDTLKSGVSIDDADILDSVLAIAEETARGDFDSGLEALELGDLSRAMFDFERPLQMDVPWRSTHKHMFSSFGSILRAKTFYPLALRHHTKALELESNDVNIYFNLAMVHYSMGNIDKAMEYLRRALKINSGMRECRLFLEYLKQKKREDPMFGPPLAM